MMKVSIPHSKNVQLAPCQIPVSSHTKNKLISCLDILHLLPPKEMYTYSLNHVLNEICQRCHNSVMLFEING